MFSVSPNSSWRQLWFRCTTAVHCGRSATLWHFSVFWRSSNTNVVESVVLLSIYNIFLQRAKLQYWMIHRYLPMQGLCQASGVSAEAQVRSQSSPRDTCGGQSGTVTDIPSPVSLHYCFIVILTLSVPSPEGQTAVWGLQKQRCFWNWGTLG